MRWRVTEQQRNRLRAKLFRRRRLAIVVGLIVGIVAISTVRVGPDDNFGGGAFVTVLVLVAISMVIAIVLALPLSQVWHAVNRRRLRRYAEWAGFEYVDRDHDFPDQWDEPPFAGRGEHWRRAVITGHHMSRSFVACQVFRRPPGEEPTHHWSVVAIRIIAPLPELYVTPVGSADEVSEHRGRIDVAIDDDEFRQELRLHAPIDDNLGEARQFAAALLTPTAVDALLTPPRVGWIVLGNELLTWSKAELTPDSVDDRLATLSAVADSIPTSYLHG